MALNIILSEEAIRNMPKELRDSFLRWYFDNEQSMSNSHQASDSSNTSTPKKNILRSGRKVSGRISFPDFVRSGLIQPGTELKCKALKRQRQKGAPEYLHAGTVQEDGIVDYHGQHYLVPSKLAVAVVNRSNGNTKALNGYNYIHIPISGKLVPLEVLRKSY